MRPTPAPSGLHLGVEAARFLLAISITLFHFNWCVPSAYLAVDLFFVLSGLFMGRGAEPRLRAGQGIGPFLRGRVVRLYPLYLVSVVLGLAAALVQSATTSEPFDFGALAWRAAFMLPYLGSTPIYPGQDQLFPLDPPAWSLWLELLANVVFAVMCRLPRWVMVIPAAAGAVFLAIWTGQYDNLSIGGSSNTIGGGMARAGLGFFGGLCLARLPATPDRIGPAGFALLAIAVAAVFVWWPYQPRYQSATVALIVLGCTAVVWMLTSTKLPPVTGGLCRLGGRISYALFLLHLPLQRIALGSATLAGYQWRSLLTPMGALAMTAATIAFAWAATAFCDEPLRRLLQRTSNRMAGLRGGTEVEDARHEDGDHAGEAAEPAR